MIRKNYANAIKLLIQSSDLSDPLSMLHAYGSVAAIYQRILGEHDATPEEDRETTAFHEIELMSYAVEYFGYAAIIGDREDKSPREWKDAALAKLILF